MRQLFVRALVRSAAGLTAVALFPLVERGARVGWRHVKAGSFGARQTVADTGCAIKHGYREYRRVRKTLRQAAAVKPKVKA
jgi:hypothetical protein